MLRFEGDKDFTQPADELFARLTDPGFLVECIPDVEKVKQVGESQATLVIRPSLAFVRGTLDVDLHIEDKNPPNSARTVLNSKGMGSSSVVEATFTLGPTETGTRAHWIAEVKSLGGLLRAVPSGLIRGAAQKVISDLWDRIAQKLTA